MPSKAIFQRLDRGFQPIPDADIPVKYNPTEFTLTKGAQVAEIPILGLDMPILQFVRGQSETVTLDLFFDTTDEGMGDRVTPVTTWTDKFYQLIKIDSETHAPPVCRFVWGASDFPGAHLSGNWASQKRENGFQCIVENIKQRFTLFNPAGIPLRATLTVALREYKSLEQQMRELHLQSPDHTRAHLVQRGETLSRIAAEHYDDPAQWRVIADHNHLEDPLHLMPGMSLELPPLQ